MTTRVLIVNYGPAVVKAGKQHYSYDFQGQRTTIAPTWREIESGAFAEFHVWEGDDLLIQEKAVIENIAGQ